MVGWQRGAAGMGFVLPGEHRHLRFLEQTLLAARTAPDFGAEKHGQIARYRGKPW